MVNNGLGGPVLQYRLGYKSLKRNKITRQGIFEV